MPLAITQQEAVAMIDEEFAGAKITSIRFEDDVLTIEARRDSDGSAHYFRLTVKREPSRIFGIAISADYRAEPWPKTLRETVEDSPFG